MLASVRRSLVATLLTAALLATCLVSLHGLAQAAQPEGTEVKAPALPGRPGATPPKTIRYLPPDERLLLTLARQRVGAQAGPGQLDQAKRDILAEWTKTYPHGPDPSALQARLNAEKLSLKTGKSVEELGLAVTGTFRVLAIAVEFAGQDRVENFSHPRSVYDSTCVTETVTYSGPLHNHIPGPGVRDNNTFWLPNFDHDYYNKVLFTLDGLTERIRPDLTDPEDGQPGINIQGQTVRHYYQEVSGGRLHLDGGPRGVVAWVQVPHSEAYYGASACFAGQPGSSGMEGLPGNPRFGFGAPTLLEDAVKAIKANDPHFPWRDYDADGDGVIDNVVLFHAGKDKSEGGGAQGYQAIWAHASTIDETQGGYTVDDGGTPDPADDIKVKAYTVHPEDAAPGVVIHELGHALGLPDLYDTGSGGETSVTIWDPMSLGMFPGKLLETNPVQMSAWSKVALGWATPQVISTTAEATEVRLGQSSHPPVGTQQVIQVNLPSERLEYTTLPAGSHQTWWTGNDQNFADVRLTRDLDLRGVTGPISFTFQTDYAIENSWDFMFVEVSVDAGQTYTQTKGLRVGTGQEVTTSDTYADPTGSLRLFGGLRYGYTGNSQGWTAVYHDLTSYAGQQIKLRLRYATDVGVLERGAFLDNFKVLAGSRVLLDDPVEGNNLAGWTPSVRGFNPHEPLGDGWRLSPSGDEAPRYYLLEWRNLDGFDRGLQYFYNSIFYVETEGKPEWWVERVPANVPGMLVWLRDSRFGRGPLSATQTILNDLAFFNGPSEGPKGGLLLIDANPMPLRDGHLWLLNTPYGWFPYPPISNWAANVQTVNAAFSLTPSPAWTLSYDPTGGSGNSNNWQVSHYAPAPGVTGFHDALGYYPGVEALPQPLVTYSDTTTIRTKLYNLIQTDASTVVPARGYYSPRTPPGFTGRGGETGPDVSTQETFYIRGGQFTALSVGQAGRTDVTGQHSGNPGDDHLQYGHHFKVVEQAADGTWGLIRVWNSDEAADVSAQASVTNDPPRLMEITAQAMNTGGAGSLTLVSDFDEEVAEYVEGSATHGAVPVRLNPLAPVTAISRTGTVGSGASLTFTYRLRPTRGGAPLTVVQRAFGPSSATQPLDEQRLSLTLPGSRLFLPFILRDYGR
ncbi:MAG: immune inhibitor A [Anaerolineae bacterium]|nr:immune inhibitor A [Anaerolineae bacterium]